MITDKQANKLRRLIRRHVTAQIAWDDRGRHDPDDRKDIDDVKEDAAMNLFRFIASLIEPKVEASS